MCVVVLCSLFSYIQQETSKTIDLSDHKALAALAFIPPAAELECKAMKTWEQYSVKVYSTVKYNELVKQYDQLFGSNRIHITDMLSSTFRTTVSAITINETTKLFIKHDKESGVTITCLVYKIDDLKSGVAIIAESHVK